MFMKILPEMYLWMRKSPLHVGSHPDSRFGPDAPYERCAFSKCSYSSCIV